MNSENDNENPDENPPVNLEKTFEHVKAGYANAQEVIRFIDTKTSFLTGASTLTIGFILEAVKQYAQLPPDIKNNFQVHPFLILVLMILGVLSLLAGCLCIWCCVMSLVGRPPAKCLKQRYTLLFPYYSGKPAEKAYYAKACSGMTEVEILKEYESQIWNVGLILRKKLIRHRWAGIMFLIQLVILTMGGIVVLICIQN